MWPRKISAPWEKKHCGGLSHRCRLSGLSFIWYLDLEKGTKRALGSDVSVLLSIFCKNPSWEQPATRYKQLTNWIFTQLLFDNGNCFPVFKFHQIVSKVPSSSGLGRRPLTPVTRVRTPLGLPQKQRVAFEALYCLYPRKVANVTIKIAKFSKESCQICHRRLP